MADEFYAPDAAGNDPDTLQRNAKHAAAAGVVAETEEPDEAKESAAKARKAAGTARTATPQGRSATATQSE